MGTKLEQLDPAWHKQGSRRARKRMVTRAERRRRKKLDEPMRRIFHGYES